MLKKIRLKDEDIQKKYSENENSSFDRDKGSRMTEPEQEKKYILHAQKDPGAFAYLYDRYFEQIFNFVYRRTGDENITSDLTSQTFLNALKSIKQYQFRGLPFSAWLYRIAGNEVNKFYRDSKTKRTFSLEDHILIEAFDFRAELMSREEQAILHEALSELPTDDLDLLQLRFYEDKTFKEIAFILDISLSSAKMRTYRCLERLKKIFIEKG